MSGHAQLQATEQDVSLVVEGGLAVGQVEDASRPVFGEEILLNVETELDGRRRGGKGDHEAVPVLLDLVAPVALDQGADAGVVERHGAGHGRGVLFPHGRRLDDVGEDDAQITLWSRSGSCCDVPLGADRFCFRLGVAICDALDMFGSSRVRGVTDTCTRE